MINATEKHEIKSIVFQYFFAMTIDYTLMYHDWWPPQPYFNIEIKLPITHLTTSKLQKFESTSYIINHFNGSCTLNSHQKHMWISLFEKGRPQVSIGVKWVCKLLPFIGSMYWEDIDEKNDLPRIAITVLESGRKAKTKCQLNNIRKQNPEVYV